MRVGRRCRLPTAMMKLLTSLALLLPVLVAAQEDNSVFLAGIFDTRESTGFPWGRELFDFTVRLLNDKSNGWHDDVSVQIDYEIADSACDESEALSAFWGLTSNHDVNGVVGARCSGASISIARLAALMFVAQVSMSSTSSKLSEKNKFPLFSRLVSSDDERGQVGALVATMALFGWDRVTILSTDTPYAKDFATEFTQLFSGDVAYSATISLDADDNVDVESVNKVLDDAPTDDPSQNSRVILLIAHGQHAFPILQIATERQFQPDSIFVGPQAWVGRVVEDLSWLPDFPGYIGVTPYRNRNADYDDFLLRLQQDQAADGREVWPNLPDYAADHTVDSIVAMAKALSQTPADQRRNGTVVTSVLRQLDFNGVSGRVRFTPEGDRQDPLFSIFNLQKQESGEFEWIDVGTTGTTVESASFGDSDIQGVCFAVAGCGLDEAPPAGYPVPKNIWVLVVVPLTSALLLFFAFKYIRGRCKKKTLKERIEKELADIDKAVAKAKARQDALILQRGAEEKKPSNWTKSTETLVTVAPDDEQYWMVADRLRKTMPDAHISKLWRVQNTSLWAYYSFHKDRFTMNEIEENERSVWHGTSALDPQDIYLDKQDGFMMQFSQTGFWGRGIYFADKSVYSHSYAYKPQTRSRDRPVGRSDEREMFLTKLLGGKEVLMNRDESEQKRLECKKLTVPPMIPGTGSKYNTVTGHTGGSQVFVVYENGRAYPEYLIRYYRGARDPKRTPFDSKNEAMGGGEASTASASDASDASDLETGNYNGGIWEWMDNNKGWKLYSPSEQVAIEAAYKAYNANPNNASQTVQIKAGDDWTYEVDVVKMVQTNMEHPGRRQRDIRRIAPIFQVDI